MDTTTDRPASPSGAPEPLVERWLFGRYDYPVPHRVVELVSFAIFVVLGAITAWRVGGSLSDHATWGSSWQIVFAVLVGLGVADLMSGVVHFLFDQLGSPETPVIGQKFVKPFRDHHDDPRAMTHGDFVAVNSDNLLICLPVLGATVAFGDVDAHPYIGVFVLALVAAVAMTNQIHKWAHMPEVPAAVRFAQRHGIILDVRHHSGHHRAPFDRHYCITFGRMDVLLDRATGPFVRGRLAGQLGPQGQRVDQPVGDKSKG